MKAAPTPGPLEVRMSNDGTGTVGIISTSQNATHTEGNRRIDWKGIVVAECFPDLRNSDERCTDEAMANATLFAASHDMRDALRAILLQVVQGKVLERDACIAQAREAYAKAGGV